MSKKITKADINEIVEYLIEELRECKDGTVITTAKLAEYCGYEEMEKSDLLDLHKALLKAAKKNHITLNMSNHKSKFEEQPFYITFVVKNKKAQIKCPRCVSTNTARYIYGYPAFSEKMKKKLDAGKWVLRGCRINHVEIYGRYIETMPRRYCNNCKKDFAAALILITPQRNIAEDYLDIVKVIKFSVGGYFEGYTDITIRKNHKGAKVTVSRMLERDDKPDERQLTTAKWNKILNILYGKLYLHEWKKSFVDPDVLDGTQWSLNISLTGNRKRSYSGSNAYPPYWNEFLKIFKEFAEL